MTPIPDSGYDMTPAGQVRLEVGDVLELRGALHICTRSVESCAVMEPLAKTKRTVVDQVFKTEATFETYGTKQRISQCVDRGLILERRGQAGVDEYLGLKKGNNMKIETGEHIAIFGDRHIAVFTDERSARLLNVNTLATLTIEREVNEFYLLDKPRLDEAQRKAALDAVVTNFSKLEGRSSEELTNPLTDLERNNCMSLRKLQNQKTKTKPRGGLYADKLASETGATKAKTVKSKSLKAGKKSKSIKPKQQSEYPPKIAAAEHQVWAASKRGANDNLFGYSATAVLRAFGKEGITVEQATKIFSALKVQVSPITITAWIGNGKRGQYGKPAPLTKDQLKSLTSQA